VNVVLNGVQTELTGSMSLLELLGQLGLGVGWVVVERNGEAVPRSQVAVTALCDGDRLEVVRAVAGG
jgi:thiamine biosynthesis protein ThiS